MNSRWPGRLATIFSTAAACFVATFFRLFVNWFTHARKIPGQAETHRMA
jgi:hypothetical protein